MPHCCLLDLLPVEILHILFTYFLAHETLSTFFDVSDYINSVLVAYPYWQLNFKSIRRHHFDLVCRHVRSENVISLTLSDDNDTPGQSELFLSRFQIEQFIHLRSLTLFMIEFESLESIFFKLDQLKQISSFSFNADSVTHKYSTRSHDYSSEFKRVNSIILDTYTRVLPHLNRLELSHAFGLVGIPLSQLCHLKITECCHDELNRIIEYSPHLVSLDVCLELENPNMTISLIPSQLTRLRLIIQSEYFYIY
jgi:hypothetical protein